VASSNHQIAQFVIGCVLGYGLHRILKREGLSVMNPATRLKAITAIAVFCLLIGIALDVSDRLSRNFLILF
jgi:NhaP-type Na+/H+ or K+/H+ antiporter